MDGEKSAVNQTEHVIFSLELPWFPRKLSPNKARTIHYHARGRIAKEYRATCKAATLSQTNKKLSKKKIGVKIIFHRSQSRMDLDNCLAAFKSGIDGIADALQTDDKFFRPIIIDFGEKVKNGKIIVTFFN